MCGVGLTAQKSGNLFRRQKVILVRQSTFSFFEHFEFLSYYYEIWEICTDEEQNSFLLLLMQYRANSPESEETKPCTKERGSFGRE